MIANALRVDIERYAASVRQKNALFTKAADGSLKREMVAGYLENLRYLISHTATHFARGRDIARARGDEALALHCDARRLEEVGHDRWAENDLADIAPSLPAPPSKEITPSMRALVDHLAERIEVDPTLYLAHCLFAEYLTVIIGPDFVRLLDEKCGVAKTSMTVIDKHVDLDRAHVEHALDEIDELVTDPRKIGPMRETARASMAFFEAFCAEVTEEARYERARVPAQQASAA